MKHTYPRLAWGSSLLVLLLCLWTTLAHAQSYQLPVTGSNSITTCSGNLYDDGGAAGNYAYNADGATTIRPATTGNRVQLQFTAFATEVYYDRMTIYDGTSTSDPVLGIYDGSNSPGTVVATNSSGALTVRLVTDGVSNYAGFAATISCVPMAPLPDLQLNSPSVTPLAIVAGNAVATNVTIYNSSVTAAPTSNIGYYLSTNNVLDASDVLLNNNLGGQLQGGLSSTRYANLTIPASTANGNYYILFAADYQNQVNESNEQNNVLSVAISVIPPGVDLTIQAASVVPNVTSPGNLLNLNCSILNQGTSVANSSNIGYYLSTNNTYDAGDLLLTSSTGGTLYPSTIGTTRYATATLPASTAPGNYFVLFVADYQNQITEVNEQNNVLAQSLTVVAPSVDLTVTQATAPTSAAVGGSLAFSAYINNLGTTTASSSTMGVYLSTDATFSTGDALVYTSLGGTLSAGTSSYRSGTGTIPTTATPGNYYLLFVADPQNQVGETNEQNNVASRTLTVVAPSADLTMNSAYVSPSTTTAGSAVNTSGYVYNTGNVQAGASSVGYYLSTNTTFDANDVLLGQTGIGSIAAGYYYSFYGTVTIPAGTATGSYYVLFVADYLNQVTESNEQNNVAYQPLTVVTPSVDLQVSSAYLSPATTAPGGTVNASGYVYNMGNTTAGASALGYYLSTDATLSSNDVLLTQSLVSTISGGYSYSIYGSLIIPTNTTPGNYYVLFVADHLNQVSETNEQNNVAARTLTVAAPAVDLVPTSATLYLSVVAAGNTNSTSGYISNNGNIMSGASSLGYYLSTDATLSSNDVLVGQTTIGSIAAGYYYSFYGSLTVPANTAAGTYYVLFVADYQNQVSESDEQNNVAARVMTVVAPGVDLLPSQPALSRTSTAAGGALTSSVYIYNQGTTTAASSDMGFYLSSNTTFDANDVLLQQVSGTSLAAGYGNYRYGSFTIPTGTAAGSYYVLFVADPLNSVSETNELNNVAYLPLTVSAPFNGTVVPFTGSATLTSCGTTVYDNGGTGDYADYSNGTLTITPSTTGAKVRITLTSFSTESGYDYLRVYDGPDTFSPLLGIYTGSAGLGAVLTATNSSGVLTLQFTSDGSAVSSGFEATVSCVGGSGGSGSPDLVVQQPAASPLTLGAGSPLTVSSVIRNQGTADATNSTVGYYLSLNMTLDASDILLGNSNGGALVAGGTATRPGTFTVPVATPIGAYNLLIVADPQNVVSESNEQNNLAIYATPITVTASTAGPDLTASQLTVLPSPAAAGGTITVVAFHENRGTVAAGAHTLAVYLSTDNQLSSGDLLLNTTSITGMAASYGITRVLSGILIPTSVALGNYYVLVVVDSQNTVTETNEQNNIVSVPLLIDRNLPAREQAGGYAISLLPNPTATGSFEVRFDGAGVSGATELTLLNSLGQVVSRQPLTLRGAPTRATFDTRLLSRGVYTLHISGKGLSTIRRVVVE